MLHSTRIHPTSTRSGGWPADSAADDHLIARSQAGDVQAFNLLVERYQQLVYALCYRMLGHGDADDVTPEVFLSAFRSIRRYHGGSSASCDVLQTCSTTSESRQERLDAA